ncbi:MAG: hypothetical protein D3923_15680 [Candidatus Electrothrix sp. AR3]|nr:hypothetical protein [Candidatus Electrothrix sp. AR3]
MLHPQAETRESNLYGIGPVGSLLIWLDQWFEKPHSVLDRSAGRYTNLGLNGHYLINSMEKYAHADIKNRSYFKVFPYHYGSNPDVPMEHGSFDDFLFWEEKFWTEQDQAEGYIKWHQE